MLKRLIILILFLPYTTYGQLNDDFESGTRAALSGGTTMVVDFALPSPGQSLLEAIQMWDNKSTRANCDYSFHMAITWWSEQVFNEMETVVKEKGINTFKHFMAYKGALIADDDEIYSSFKRCIPRALFHALTTRKATASAPSCAFTASLGSPRIATAITTRTSPVSDTVRRNFISLRDGPK